jgi:hypothetical protein
MIIKDNIRKISICIMKKFSSFNQFDARFSGNVAFKNRRNACPVFSLLMAHYFLKDGITTRSRYENILETAVDITCENKHFPKFMNFNEAVQFYKGYGDHQVLSTTPDLINLIGYINFEDEESTIFRFPDFPMNYAVVFLKQSNFFVVLVKFGENGTTYHIRDCHEKEQYDCTSFEHLVNHLNSVYRFDKMTIVDGINFHEHSNIEYLRLENPFEVVGMSSELLNNEDEDKENDSHMDDLGISVDFSGLMSDGSDEDSVVTYPENPVVVDDADADLRLAMQLQMQIYQEAGGHDSGTKQYKMTDFHINKITKQFCVMGDEDDEDNEDNEDNEDDIVD